MHLINSLILSHGYFADRRNKIPIPVSDFVEFPQPGFRFKYVTAATTLKLSCNNNSRLAQK